MVEKAVGKAEISYISPFPTELSKTCVADMSKYGFVWERVNVVCSKSKRVVQRENSVGKGEIAHNKQFLLFPQSFQKLMLQTCINTSLFGKGLLLFAPSQKELYAKCITIWWMGCFPRRLRYCHCLTTSNHIAKSLTCSYISVITAFISLKYVGSHVAQW